MYPQPRFLQQVIRLFPARHLAPEESKQSGADSANQSCRRIRIRLLVALHPTIQVGKRLAGCHVILDTALHLWVIRRSNPRSYGRMEHFLETPDKSTILNAYYCCWP
jgi:hypothetical protein